MIRKVRFATYKGKEYEMTRNMDGNLIISRIQNR